MEIPDAPSFFTEPALHMLEIASQTNQYFVRHSNLNFAVLVVISDIKNETIRKLPIMFRLLIMKKLFHVFVCLFCIIVCLLDL